jgi:hypothetical protein
VTHQSSLFGKGSVRRFFARIAKNLEGVTGTRCYIERLHGDTLGYFI